jgi:hypothetical protein
VLAAAGSISAAIAALQFVIYFGGPVAYQTFGAPPTIAEMRGAEPVRMLVWSTFWFGLFLTFALYAFSGAGLLRRLPALRPCLIAIAVTYGIRSLAIVPQLVFLDQFPVTRARDVAFSALSLWQALGYGIGAHGISGAPRRRGGSQRSA